MKFITFLVLAAGPAFDQASRWDRQGRGEFAAGQLRSAKKSFERAVREAGDGRRDQAVSLTNLGQTLLALGEFAAAKDAVTRAAKILPGSARIEQLRGQVLVKSGDRKGGEKAIRSALEAPDQDPETAASCYSDLATLLLASGRRKEAAQMLERAVAQARPGQAKARMLANMGVLQWRSGRKAVAAGTIRRALTEMEASVGARHPDVARILDDYAEVLAKIGHKAESRAAAERAGEMKAAFGWQANAGSATVDWHDLR